MKRRSLIEEYQDFDDTPCRHWRGELWSNRATIFAILDLCQDLVNNGWSRGFGKAVKEYEANVRSLRDYSSDEGNDLLIEGLNLANAIAAKHGCVVMLVEGSLYLMSRRYANEEFDE